MPSHNLMTADELLARSEQIGPCELVKGELVMMAPAGGDHGLIGMRLVRHLDRFIETHKLGELTLAETGFLLERSPDTVRAPDIAFIRRDRLDEARTEKFIPIAPDLVVEVNSPGDTVSAVAEKVQWWLRCGVRLVWVVDPKSKTVTAYHPDGSARVLQQEQTLDGGDVLPGFTLTLTAIFSD